MTSSVSIQDMCFLYGPLLSFSIKTPQHVAFLSTIANEWEIEPTKSFLMTFLGCVLHLNTKYCGCWSEDVATLRSYAPLGWKESPLYVRWNVYCTMLCDRTVRKGECRAFMTTVDEMIAESLKNNDVKDCGAALCCCTEGRAQIRGNEKTLLDLFRTLRKTSLPQKTHFSDLTDDDLTENEDVVFETPQKKKRPRDIVYETP